MEAANDGSGSPAVLCKAATTILSVTGASIMLMSRDVPVGSLCAVDGVSGLIEELQHTLGEGPCIDAYRKDQVVTEPELADPLVARWPAFTPPALEAGVRAIFGFPIRLGGARLGALNLYMDRPGALGDDRHADALIIADVVAQWVLNAQAGAPAGTLARQLEAGSDLHFVVHNAAGMVSVQLGVTVTEAHVRMRARAFRENRLVREVAADVVARRLRFQ